MATDNEVISTAINFVKDNHKTIIASIVSDAVPSEIQPLSIFMAGHPGAGKTEFAQALNKVVAKKGYGRAVMIDPDKIRESLPGYVGSNAELFQWPVSKAVDKVHDHVLHNKMSFILDGTFSSLAICRANIKRSVDKERVVFIFYIYQDPLLSWEITKAREAKTGRHVP
ncbi:MAG: zeta toxin family protein, partial [Candidatus Berkelbacteria bacterium]|nr:zeta toxin family protein [Candidatus Berkelbacteria bacterium]